MAGVACTLSVSSTWTLLSAVQSGCNVLPVMCILLCFTFCCSTMLYPQRADYNHLAISLSSAVNSAAEVAGGETSQLVCLLCPYGLQ